MFGRKGQVTEVTQVTSQFFFGEGLLVTVVTVVTVVTQVTDQFFFGKGLVVSEVTVITLVTQVTDGAIEFFGEKVKLR